jgi:hypothetical protein
MKSLVLLVLVGVAGYFAYSRWTVEEEVPVVQVAVVQEPEPVDFVVRMRVRRAIEVWKDQTAGRQRPSLVEVGAEVNSIRHRLYGTGRHDQPSLKQTMVRAAVELGHPPDQAEFLIGKILAAAAPAPPARGASQPREPGDTEESDAPVPPVLRMRSVGGGN